MKIRASSEDKRPYSAVTIKLYPIQMTQFKFIKGGFFFFRNRFTEP